MNVEYIASLKTPGGLACFSQKTTLPFVPKCGETFRFKSIAARIEQVFFMAHAARIEPVFFMAQVETSWWCDHSNTLCVVLDVAVDKTLPLKLLVETMNSVGFITSDRGGISLPGDDIGLAKAYQNERKKH